jgi:PAS domain S-box-containing protein
MIGVAIVVGATALGVFYDAAFEREKQRLVNFADGQAHLIEALPPDRRAEILEQQRRLRETAAGQTSELQLARREGDLIVFLTPARGSHQPHDPVPFGGPKAEPMTAALSGRSGTMIGRDYRGHRVLAAFEPVPALDLGLVAKIDMAEINGRYLRAGSIAGLVSLAAVLAASFLFLRVGEPMVRRLRESEQRYRNLVEAQPDPICQFLPDTTLTFVNRAYAEFYGREPEELIGQRWLDFAAADERPRFLEELSSFTPEDPERHEETRSTRADREVRWYLCHMYGFFDGNGNIVSFQTFGTDITERKRAEEALKRQIGVLAAITDSAADAIFVSDREERVTLMNAAAERIFGWSRQELIGRKLHDVIHNRYPDGRPYPASDCPLRRELLNKKKNGELFWELASIAPVKQGETVTNFVAVKEDITERKQIEEQLRQSQKMQALGQLTGGIAHDFNNLLGIVIGNLQLLGERVGDDARNLEYLDDALWAARRGGELTHRLLAFARKQPLKPTVIDLNEVVTAITELLRRTLGMGIRIEESLAPDLWKALADRGELERALVNLAVNSRDAMRGAGTLTLETRNALLDEDYAEQYEEVTPGQYVLLAFTDTGTGMPPEVTERVFEPFFTTKEVGQGSGLGLSMVYGFVKQSGGHVSIYSRVGQGTCVKLYLPRAPLSPGDRREGSSDVHFQDIAEKVVLVVEDESKLRRVAVKMLDRLGLRSLQAESAKDALELLADAHVDVLFTDIELAGGMNGTELAEEAHHLYPQLKVLFTTGFAREATLHERGLDEHAPWLLKPYSHQELARELKALLAPTVH